MLSAIARVFRTPDLRRKLLFTLSIIAIYRLGVYIPAPGVDYGNVQQCLEMGDTSGGLYQFVNLFSGGALLQVSIFALGIMPYITASIIVQLLRVVIPRFEDLHKEGAAGQATLTQYTRYLTIALGLLQATTLVSLARSGNLFQGCQLPIIPDQSIVHILLMVIVLTAGTGMIMWLGELVTEKGVGNGMSILIFVSIASGFPSSMGSIASTQGWGVFTGVIIIGLCVVALVVFVELSQRRVPVQYAKRMVGRRQYGGTSTYLPLKVNQAGVIPVIFASSLMYVPILITQLIQGPDASGDGFWQRYVMQYLQNPSSAGYIVLYFALIMFFSYFYVAIQFDPMEQAENMKKYGGFIPGIRPGRPTAEYLGYVLNRILLFGSLYLGLIAVLPNVFLDMGSGGGSMQNMPFGGTAVLIMVSVGLDTVKQVEAQLMQRNYEGFLK